MVQSLFVCFMGGEELEFLFLKKQTKKKNTFKVVLNVIALQKL